jgi:hypothetical protein
MSKDASATGEYTRQQQARQASKHNSKRVYNFNHGSQQKENKTVTENLSELLLLLETLSAVMIMPFNSFANASFIS